MADQIFLLRGKVQFMDNYDVMVFTKHQGSLPTNHLYQLYLLKLLQNGIQLYNFLKHLILNIIQNIFHISYINLKYFISSKILF